MSKTSKDLIDFSVLATRGSLPDFPDDELTNLADEICKRFIEKGYVYLTNHGIAQEQVTTAFEEMDKFFQLDVETKSKYILKDASESHGWMARGDEETDGVPDLKETFNMRPAHAAMWPQELPNLQKTCENFYKNVSDFAKRIEYMVAVGLKLKDPHFFTKLQNPSDSTNKSFLRWSFYPASQDTKSGKKQFWCGPHTDFEYLSIVFQDKVGGLEIMQPDGSYNKVPPIPGTAVVMMGDTIQRWTADKIKAVRHQVVPKTHTDRRSLVFFLFPNDDTVIRCLDGSDKYKPVTAQQWYNQNFFKIAIAEKKNTA